MEQHTRHYDALRSRDRRFDGTFYVGVRSTMIYCRPVCRARRPLARNCTFFRTAAEAERGGYRPCLKCRPELAPGRSLTDASDRLARAAMERIAAGALNERPLSAVARDLCVGERHLRRVVTAEFGASPVELAQTQRLLLAKQLLTESDLPVSRIAYASGFSSLSRFNALFLSRYRLSPTRLRQTRRAGVPPDGSLRLLFEYRPPYDWEWMLGFLRIRAIPGIEAVDDASYSRSLRIGTHTGWFTVRATTRSAHALEVEISDSLLPVLITVRALVRNMFDLDAEPAVLIEHFASDDVMAPLVARCPGLRLPGAVDGFELAVRGVLGQQISVAAARTLAGRLHAAFGDPLAAAGAAPDLTHVPATPERLAAADPAAVSGLGMPLSRARTVVLLARSVVRGEISFAPTHDIEAAMAALQRVPGIGAWTAEYIALRAYQWPDAFPATDLGIRNALRGRDAMMVSEPWRPWRGYAAIHLWNSLSANPNPRVR